MINSLEKTSSNEALDNSRHTGWEDVAAMADGMSLEENDDSPFGDFDDFFENFKEEDAEWFNVENESENVKEIETKTYSPEVVCRALEKAELIAEALLDEQSFQDMQSKGEFDEDDTNDALDTIAKVNAISYEDWQQKITAKDEYEYGKPYAMIVRSVRSGRPYNPKDIQHIYKYTSCSLVTQDNVKLYHDRIGFVYPAEGIVAADTGDMATNNEAQNTDDILSFREVPLIKPFNEVLENTGKSTGYGFVGNYNEVVVQGLPSAIFYYDEADLEEVKNLQELSGLDIIKLYEGAKDS